MDPSPPEPQFLGIPHLGAPLRGARGFRRLENLEVQQKDEQAQLNDIK
jgi:hypothetical protein